MNLKVDKVIVPNFRKLVDIEPIKIGKKITVVSGVNGVGKSNLLSMIASGSGLTRKKESGGNFQPNFMDFFKIDQNEKIESYRIYVQYKDEQDGSIFTKRIGFKDDTARGRGIRVIPRTSQDPTKDNKTLTQTQAINEVKDKYNIGGSARVPIPTIFISLSRLFPLGEVEVTTKNISRKAAFTKSDAISKFINWYNTVLPNSISPNTSYIESLSKDAFDGKYFYVPIENTTAVTQSVGQDNLGAIISALVDFYILSQQEGYSGGILCIDEVDASLHPSAQKRLLDLLSDLTEELNLQIFVSSHSLTFLRSILDLNKTAPDDFELIYFKDQDNPYPTTYKNYRSLKADLFDSYDSFVPKVKIYCEDKETARLLELLIDTAISLDMIDKKKLPNYELIPVFLGCQQLFALPKYDPHFNDVAIILDGDARTDTRVYIEDYIKNHNITRSYSTRQHRDTIVYLPTFLPPESFLYSIIYDYVHDSKRTKDFWRKVGNNPETSTYTPSRVNDNLLKVDNLCNDTLKGSDLSEKLFSFCEKTAILEDYYTYVPKELKKFADELMIALNILQKKLKSHGF